ncbi:MAG: MBL fold metallo-hydrolase [Chloroflexota bacterium]
MLLHKSIPVVDGLIFYVWQGRGNNCNTCLFPNILRGETPHVIIDPGAVANEAGELCFESLAKAIENDGFKVEDIGLVLNTHYHTDHYAAGEAIMEKSRALLAMTKEDQEWGRTLSDHVYAAFGAAKPKYQPFFYLKEGTLELGVKDRLTLQVIAAPGHSPGSVAFYWPDKKVLITGDTVFYGSIGRTDFPGGNLMAIKKSIERLSELDVEYLLPGHSTEYGSIITGKQNIIRNFQAVKLII